MTIIGDGDRKELEKKIPKMVSVAPSCGKFLYREILFQLEMLNQPKGARFCLFDKRIIFLYFCSLVVSFCSSVIISKSSENSSYKDQNFLTELPDRLTFKSVLDPAGSLRIEFSGVNVLQEPCKKSIKTD